MPGFYPLNRLLAEIDENPIEGAKTAQKRYDGVRTANYESSVSAGALYRALKKSKAMQSAFYALPFWAEGNARDPKHLNKHCHQFVYGARDGSEGKRAEDHAYATQSIFDDNTKSLEEILEVLKASGFDGLKKPKPKSEEEIRTRLKEIQAPERKRGSAVGDTKSNGAPGGSSLIRASVNEAGGPPKFALPKITLMQVFEHLLVAMEEHELALFLAGNSKVGDRYGIMIEREANDANGMLVWRAVEIEKALDTE